ncbi:MAG: helix-turn-helix domain-containing protein [Candidatus Diapherotrites archaeon]|nr:helix-turn-helix domain-containing protein [Candidatus Diapherotrites archaeon]
MPASIVNFLQKLGLTEYEAKVLDTMFKLGEAYAPHVSRDAQVPKTRVYDVLDKLVERNLIIEIYGRPKKYKVTNPEKAVSALIEDRKQEISDLEKRTPNILKDLDIKDFVGQSERVMKVKDQSDFVKILSHEIDQAKNSIVGFTGLVSKHSQLKDVLKSASNRKVGVKLLHKNLDAGLAQNLLNNKVSVKDFEHDMNAYVIDGKKVVLALSNFNEANPEYHFTVWQNNPQMADLVGNYFENCWKKGK